MSRFDEDPEAQFRRVNAVRREFNQEIMATKTAGLLRHIAQPGPLPIDTALRPLPSDVERRHQELLQALKGGDTVQKSDDGEYTDPWQEASDRIQLIDTGAEALHTATAVEPSPRRKDDGGIPLLDTVYHAVDPVRVEKTEADTRIATKAEDLKVKHEGDPVDPFRVQVRKSARGMGRLVKKGATVTYVSLCCNQEPGRYAVHEYQNDAGRWVADLYEA